MNRMTSNELVQSFNIQDNEVTTYCKISGGTGYWQANVIQVQCSQWGCTLSALSDMHMTCEMLNYTKEDTAWLSFCGYRIPYHIQVYSSNMVHVHL